MIKEVSIKFDDGEWIVRAEGGDSIMGPSAHAIMHRMNEATSYKELPFRPRIDFIIYADELGEYFCPLLSKGIDVIGKSALTRHIEKTQKNSTT